MKIWMDDLRPAPEGYFRCYNVEHTIASILDCEQDRDMFYLFYLQGGLSYPVCREKIEARKITEIACDNDLGEDYLEGYKLLDWLEATGRNYPIRILTDNPVARERMRTIIQRNGWEEVK